MPNFLNPLAGFRQFMAGLGYVPVPDPGNQGNAPANPPVQTGDYQFIQEDMYGPVDLLNSTGRDNSITSIAPVPPAYMDSNAYPVNEFGLSGLEGGGISGVVPNPFYGQGNTLFYDETTGLYVDLGQ